VPLQLAIVGRPNVGKSTLLNTLLQEERVLVGPEAGLTRDSIRAHFEFQGRTIHLVNIMFPLPLFNHMMLFYLSKKLYDVVATFFYSLIWVFLLYLFVYLLFYPLFLIISYCHCQN
jgi:GTPase Era involved in 16S rRNA processing